MTPDKVSAPFSLPTGAPSKGQRDHSSSMGSALVMAVLALVNVSTIVAQNSAKEQELNNSISDLLTKRQSQDLQKVIDKYTAYYQELQKQKSSSNWLHYIGIGYIMDAFHLISEKFDDLIGSALRAIGVPEDKIKFVTGVIKAAIVVALAITIGVLSGGSLAAVAITAGLALMVADPSQDLVVGGVDAFGGNKEVASIAAACVSAVLMLATLCVGGVAGGLELTEKLPGMIEKLGAVFSKLASSGLIQKLAEVAPNALKIAQKVGAGAQTVSSIATGSSQVASGYYGIKAGQALKELAPLEAITAELLGAIKVTNQYVKLNSALEKATQRSMQTDSQNLMHVGQTMIQTAQEKLIM